MESQATFSLGICPVTKAGKDYATRYLAPVKNKSTHMCLYRSTEEQVKNSHTTHQSARAMLKIRDWNSKCHLEPLYHFSFYPIATPHILFISRLSCLCYHEDYHVLYETTTKCLQWQSPGGCMQAKLLTRDAWPNMNKGACYCRSWWCMEY